MAVAKKIVAFFFVVIFVSYYASTSLFSHFHIISGANIAHSHVHDNSHHDTKNGGHTEYEITLISQIAHFEYVIYSLNNIPTPPQFSLHENDAIKTPDRLTSIHLQNLSLRAPPVWV